MIRERWGTGAVGGGACRPRGQSGRGLRVLSLRSPTHQSNDSTREDDIVGTYVEISLPCNDLTS